MIQMKVSSKQFAFLEFSVKYYLEFEDDTEIIPRSTTVIAKRLPAARPGKGGAARYVSGKPPLNARNSHRAENSSLKNSIQNQEVSATASNISELQTEEQRMNAVLKMGEEQWKRQQKDMAKWVYLGLSY